MRIQVLNPANSFKPVPAQQVNSFINGGAVKNEITLRITPNEDHDLKISNIDNGGNGITCFDDRTRITSMQVSTHVEISTPSNFGLTHFGINEQKRVA